MLKKAAGFLQPPITINKLFLPLRRFVTKTHISFVLEISGSLIAPEGSQIYNNYISPLQQCDDLPFIVFSGKDETLKEINDLIREIYHCFRKQPPCYEMMIQRNISRIFEYIYSNMGRFPRYKSNRIQLVNQIRLQKMLDFIYTHYQKQISLKDLARAANMSRNEAGRCCNNAKMERFWWALKYEYIKIKDYVSLPQLRFGVQHYVNFYNSQRIHSALQYKTPDEVYFGTCNSANRGYISSRPFTPIF